MSDDAMLQRCGKLRRCIPSHNANKIFDEPVIAAAMHIFANGDIDTMLAINTALPQMRVPHYEVAFLKLSVDFALRSRDM
ncbi:hypothetical protein D3C85_1689090 [compost metagenome]